MHDAGDDTNYDEEGNFGEEGFAFREVEIREQDRFLPVANIARIMKKVLPNNAKIAKDAKEGIQECLSEFISFITSEASDKCQQEKRKTINGDDLLWAMSALGFDKYIEPLKIYLAKYRESVKGEKPEKKPAVRPKDATYPSMHAQAKTPMGGMNMMMGMQSGAMATGMHSGGGDSMNEYNSYHHSFVGNTNTIQSSMPLDPSHHLAASQNRAMPVRLKVEEGSVPGSDNPSSAPAGYSEMPLHSSPNPGHPIQYPLQVQYEHDPHQGVARSSGMPGYGATPEGFTM